MLLKCPTVPVVIPLLTRIHHLPAVSPALHLSPINKVVLVDGRSTNKRNPAQQIPWKVFLGVPGSDSLVRLERQAPDARP